MAKTVVFLHPDLGIGGAERLVVDAAVGLQDRGYKVVVFTSHCDPKHCFDEARDGKSSISLRNQRTNSDGLKYRHSRCPCPRQQPHPTLSSRPFLNPLRHPATTPPNPTNRPLQLRAVPPQPQLLLHRPAIRRPAASPTPPPENAHLLLLPLSGSSAGTRTTEVVEEALSHSV